MSNRDTVPSAETGALANAEAGPVPGGEQGTEAGGGRIAGVVLD
jgi:hypothetical protein